MWDRARQTNKIGELAGKVQRLTDERDVAQSEVRRLRARLERVTDLLDLADDVIAGVED